MYLFYYKMEISPFLTDPQYLSHSKDLCNSAIRQVFPNKPKSLDPFQTNVDFGGCFQEEKNPGF